MNVYVALDNHESTEDRKFGFAFPSPWQGRIPQSPLMAGAQGCRVGSSRFEIYNGPLLYYEW